MARYHNAITAFSAGELGPQLRSRTDINEYQFGLEEMKNFLSKKSGGAFRRPGSRFIEDFSNILGTPGAEPPGLYPFVFSQDEAYIVVMKPGEAIADAISVYKRNGKEITNTFINITIGTLTLPVPDFPANLDATKFQYAQTGDRMYIVHSTGFIPPIILQRTSEDTFEYFHYLGAGERGGLGTPYEDANTDIQIQLYFNAISSPAYKVTTASTFQMDAVDSTGASINFFNTDHIGAFFRVTDEAESKEALVVVKSIVSASRADVISLVGWDADLVGVANRTDNWKQSSWSNLKGYPQTITFYEQRLIFGGNFSKPDTIWSSEIGIFNRFMQDRLDQDISSDFSGIGTSGDLVNSDAFSYTIASTEVNYIQWLSVEDVLMAGTSGTEYTIAPIDGTFGRNNISIQARSSFGSDNVQAFKAGRGLIHITRDGQNIRRLTFSDANGQAGNIDLTTLNNDIIRYNPGNTTSSTQYKGVKIIQMAWQQSRSTMWFVTSRKVLIGITIDQSSNTVAFHKHALGGKENSTGHAQILGIISLPNEDNTFEDLWLLVRRTIAISTTADYLEKIGDDFEAIELSNTSTDENDHPYYLDSSIRFTATEASTIKNNFSEDLISVSDDWIDFGERHNYHLGQEVQLTGPVGQEPGGLSYSTNYYVIPITREKIRLATSVANAEVGGSIDITSVPGLTVSYNLTPTSVSTLQKWSGLDHLRGRTISVLADGAYIGEFTVITDLTGNLGHTIDIGVAASEVIIGFSYESRLKTLPIEAGAQFGVSKGNITRIDRATLLLYKSFAAEVGVDSDEDGENLEELEIDASTSFTGDHKLDFPQSPDRLGQVVVKTDKPLPLSVLGLRLRGVSYDG